MVIGRRKFRIKPWYGPEDRVDSLEHKLQRELNQTWVIARVCGGYLSESVRISRNETRARESELRVVEQIEEFSAEFDSEPLPNLRPLEDGEIKIVDSIRTQRGIYARFITKTPLRRRRETIRIEPTCQTAVARFIATGYNVGAYVAHAEAGIFQGSRRTGPCNLQRKTALEGSDSVNSPSGDQLAHHSARTTQEHLSLAKGEIQDVADDQALGNIL